MYIFSDARTLVACAVRDGLVTGARTRLVTQGVAFMASARMALACVSTAGTACTARWRAAPTSAPRPGRESARLQEGAFSEAEEAVPQNGPVSASQAGRERTVASGLKLTVTTVWITIKVRNTLL